VVNSDSECAVFVWLSTAKIYDKYVTEGDSVIMHCEPKVIPGGMYFWIKDFNYLGPQLPTYLPPLKVCVTTVKILVFSRPYFVLYIKKLQAIYLVLYKR